jgi:hypothetical protein
MDKFDSSILTKGKKIVLYYQGGCRKCQIISLWVVRFSLNTITRIPLEREDSIKLFFEEYPKAKGYPILFLKGKPIYNYWVFLGVPIAVLIGWIDFVKRFFAANPNNL